MPKYEKPGRPKGAPYKSITFRVTAEHLEQARQKYGKQLNQLFKEWLKGITNDTPNQ